MLVNRITNSYVSATIFEIARTITRDHGVDMTEGEWYIPQEVNLILLLLGVTVSFRFIFWLYK